MNKNLRIIYPSLLAVAVVFGILLGSNMNKRTNPGISHPVNIFQPDKLSLFLKLIEKDYVDSVNKAELIENAIPAILEQLDPHTTYIPAKDMQAVSEEMRGNFSGIGVHFVMQSDTVMIVDVVSGGPSEKVGIMAGDRIVKVNDNIVAGIGLKSDSIVSLLKGKKGTIVNVTIYRPAYEDSLEFQIERGEIPLFSVDVSYMITDKIGLIKVDRFAETTHREFVQGIKKLQASGAEKLIVDLRGNSGGYLEIAYQIIDELLPANELIVYTEGHSRQRQDYMATEVGNWEGNDVVVLIDEFSASASEILAGAVQDNDRGLIIGRRSFGKGLVQEQIPFFDGSALRLTVSRYYTPSGRSIQKSYENGNDAYMMDYHNRLMHDELSQKDSIHFNDSLKYYTVGGRTVYGGGGIMPDIFVPVDTVGINQFYTQIARRNLVYYYAFEYVDKNRNVLSAMETADEIDAYLSKANVFSAFIDYAKEKGIKINKKEMNESKHILKAQLHAYISRNVISDDGFYPIIFKIDNTVQKAVEVLEEGSWNSKEIAKLSE